MTGTLDRLEALAKDSLLEYRDVLALVSLAKAAQEYVGAEQADDAATTELLAGSPDPNREEQLRDAQKATRRDADKKYERLAAALARLEDNQ